MVGMTTTIWVWRWHRRGAKHRCRGVIIILEFEIMSRSNGIHYIALSTKELKLGEDYEQYLF